MNEPPPQPESLKTANQSRVFDILKSERVISRPKLAKAAGLSRATIAILTDELLDLGLVEEVGLGASTGGRPPVMLKFLPDAAYALGAHMYDSTWRIVITDLDAKIIHKLDAHIADSTPEAAVQALKTSVAEISTRTDAKLLLPAIGLGTPGLVDMREGIIKLAADIDWHDVPFGDMVQEALGLRTIVANRSKVGALAEYWHEAKHGISDLIYISIGTGIAAGIIHNGRLYVGANSSAGELGHLTVLPDGPICPCGNRGCLQQLVSGPAIANLARRRLRKGGTSSLRAQFGTHPELITAIDVFEAAERADPLAQEVVEEVASYMGIAIANLINLFNPELIVLGGPVGQAAAALIPPLTQEVRCRAMAYPLSVANIATSSLGMDASAIGASVLVLQRSNVLFFREP
ncbi:MAG: ROK family protein [Anaerolineae bacterium]|nr:ROK family protein [Anaerolineae bacterium]